jgi:hypothetical protein
MTPPPICSSLEVEEIIKRKKQRKQCSFSPNYQCFISNSENEADQYFHLYSNRLQHFRPVLIERIKKMFGKGLFLVSTLQLSVVCK